MKIHNSDTATLTGTTQTSNVAAGSSASRQKKASGQSASDQVQLSTLGGHLRALSTDSQERRAHVESIAAAVDSGRYRANSNATSAKIVQQSMSSGVAA